MKMRNTEEDERLRIVAEQVRKEYKEKEIPNLLLKAVKDNADKFEANGEERRFEFNNELFVNYYESHDKYVIIKYKSLIVYVKEVSPKDRDICVNNVKNNEPYEGSNPYYQIWYFHAKKHKEKQELEKLELEKQQQKDLEELKKLCN